MSENIFTNLKLEPAQDQGGLVALASVDVMGRVHLEGIRVVMEAAQGSRPRKIYISFPGRRVPRSTNTADEKQFYYKDLFDLVDSKERAELKQLVLEKYESQ